MRRDIARPAAAVPAAGGLTVGAAGFYGESPAIRETVCMKRDAEACCFEVRLERR
jgi:hypothetical protein